MPLMPQDGKCNVYIQSLISILHYVMIYATGILLHVPRQMRRGQVVDYSAKRISEDCNPDASIREFESHAADCFWEGYDEIYDTRIDSPTNRI